jgi:hypothetical protein
MQGISGDIDEMVPPQGNFSREAQEFAARTFLYSQLAVEILLLDTWNPSTDVFASRGWEDP